MVHNNNTAYFSSGRDIYSYTIPEDKWSKLKPCSFKDFSMAVVNHKLTTIGGWDKSSVTNTLLCLSGSSSVLTKWKKLLPPMHMKRVRPAAVTTPTHLVVAGGRTQEFSFSGRLSTVEVLNLHTLQWASASSSPEALQYPSMTLCGEYIYLSGNKTLFSCSVEDLVNSCKLAITNSSSVWTRLPDTPTHGTTLATLRGCVLTLGGSDKYAGGIPTGAIHCYDRSTNSWSAIGEMPTPRYATLVAVLPSNELVVVGGRDGLISWSSITEIAHP